MNSKDVSYYKFEAIIDEWVLHERNRKIMKRRLLDGICYEPLAEEFNLSTRQVKRIVKKYQKKILEHI